MRAAQENNEEIKTEAVEAKKEAKEFSMAPYMAS